MRSSIIPIEVKSGASGSLKSLHQFMGTKDAPLAVKIDTKLPSVQHLNTVIQENKQRKQIRYDLLSLPLYLVEQLETIVAGCLIEKLHDLELNALADRRNDQPEIEVTEVTLDGL